VTIPAPLKDARACRSCGSTDLVEIVPFGAMPIADRLVAPDDQAEEYIAPLTLVHCNGCALCQIRETVAPRVLFGPDYPYYSSVSQALLKHFGDSARAIIARRGLGPGDLVVEAASNDGYMLRVFHEAGIPVLGIDPADGPVGVARKHGIETVHDFFTAALAQRLAGEGRKASVFLANNVLAHVEDVNGFVSGVATLLADDGMAVIEAPYLIDLVDTGAFDTIYHQHLLYLSLTALVPLFARHGLHLNDVERTWVHGGSLRLFITRETGQSERLLSHLASEEERKVRTAEFYRPFVERIARMRDETRAAISRLKQAGARVAGYGAAAKATTLLHYFGLDRDDLDFIVDKSPWKQGLAMPVTRIPILPPAALAANRPDAVLLLAWNFADEIISENAAYLEAGGRFIVPVPRLREVVRSTAEAAS
jgi:hypothetical protein